MLVAHPYCHQLQANAIHEMDRASDDFADTFHKNAQVIFEVPIPFNTPDAAASQYVADRSAAHGTHSSWGLPRDDTTAHELSHRINKS
ncbi:hypothetical protein EVAR_91370_1 [Eumeta japonica]|uniref:Uncharacterized protein n=1 Tax=Eumeta variegata TaxID=151549 RepID=A0A4C1XDR9_EUMVA|nr:hypothetical protein EVAR_91370_1 [Eumeta japonica]